MKNQMILSLLKRVLAWIGTRFLSRELEKQGGQKEFKVKVEPDETSNEQPLVILDKPAHANNYGNRPEGIDISLIVLHYTASGSLDATVRWFQNPDAKVSAHYIIGRDGTIVRMVLEEKKAYHTGKSEWSGQNDVNRFSIGIELVNWGLLKRINGEFFVWTNDYSTHYFGDQPIFKDGQWWQPYPTSQRKALSQLIDKLRANYEIHAVVGHSDVSPGRKIDPGPVISVF